MNGGKSQVKSGLGGYTIVETLIFLAVTGMMFFMAMLIINGQQNKNQFIAGVRDFESQLTDIANNVATGYYESPASFTCQAQNPGGAGAYPKAIVGTGDTETNRGSHGDCMFVGTVVKFNNGASGSSDDQFEQVTMAGLRLKDGAGTADAALLPETHPTAIKGPVGSEDAAVRSVNLQYGVTVACVRVGANCSPADTGSAAVGFFTRLRGSNIASTRGGSGIYTDLVSYNGSIIVNGTPNSVKLEDTKKQFVHTISSSASGGGTAYGAYDTTTLTLNPTSGITICLKSAGTKQYALLRLGANGGNGATIISEIKSYSGSTPSCN